MKKLFTITLSLIFTCSFSQWTIQNSGITSTLYSVDFLTESMGWVTGAGDVIKTTRDGGQSWEMVPGQLFPSYSTWYSICFVNENEGYVCGNYTQDWYEAWWKFTTNGCDTWTRPSGSFIPNTSRWTNVFFLNEEIGWRVGYRNGEGKVSKTTTGVGEDWHSGTTVTEPIYDIMFIDENSGWMVGYPSAILKTTNGGLTWNNIYSGSSVNFTSIYFINENIGYVVGSKGTILKTSDAGETWNSQFSGTNKTLNSVYFINENIGYTVGLIGTILKTNDGGSVWVNDDLITKRFLVYPNPVLNEVTVEINDISNSSQLSIINISGQELLKTKLTNKKTTLELKNFPYGIYFIKHVNDRTVEVKKIIKK